MTTTLLPVHTFGRCLDVLEIPNLVEIQTKAYADFLMVDMPQAARPIEGLESLLREIFPIYSYDKTMCLEYVGYELGKPRYTIDMITGMFMETAEWSKPTSAMPSMRRSSKDRTIATSRSRSSATRASRSWIATRT